LSPLDEPLVLKAVLCVPLVTLDEPDLAAAVAPLERAVESPFEGIEASLLPNMVEPRVFLRLE
jgi:hypothetical protein